MASGWQRPKTPFRSMAFLQGYMPSASELQRMHDALRFLRIRNGSITFASDGGLCLECGGESEDYAFRVRQTGALELTVTGGNAYMVNEAATVVADTVLSVPDTAGTYAVWMKHTYGIRALAGTWGTLSVTLTSAVPSELTGGKITSRVFTIASLSVTAGSVGSLLQHWRQGDLVGYAPYIPA